jgi:hypothetical protein
MGKDGSNEKKRFDGQDAAYSSAEEGCLAASPSSAEA